MNSEAIAKEVEQLSLLRQKVVELEVGLDTLYDCITDLEKQLDPILMQKGKITLVKESFDSTMNDSLLKRLSKISDVIHKRRHMLLGITERLDL